MNVSLLQRWGKLVILLIAAWPLVATRAQGLAPELVLEPVTLRVMAYNIWVGGEIVDFGKTVEAIRAANVDVVALQEPGGNARRIAEALGWQHVSELTSVISRYPLIELGGSSYVYVVVRPGQVFAVANVHLTSDPYGPYLARDGETLEAILQNEEDTRMGEIRAILAGLGGLLADDTPLVMLGDFNTPSHLDWTEAALASRGGGLTPVEWPVTQAIEAAGFVDTFRAVHPDPVAIPGNTWTYGYSYPRLNSDEMIDRIDMIHAAGPIIVRASAIVGPEGTPNADVGIQNYGSDHRAVVSTLEITPVVPPYFAVAQNHVIERGEPLVVWYHAPNGEAADRVAITRVDESAGNAALMWLPPYEASFFGSVTFGSATLAPGAYDAVLLANEAEELGRGTFWVRDPAALPEMSTDKAAYAIGEPITLAWKNAPGYHRDWVGIYAAGDPDLYNGYWAYVYTGALPEGSATLDPAGLTELPVGEYVARLFVDDGYALLAESRFTLGE